MAPMGDYYCTCPRVWYGIYPPPLCPYCQMRQGAWTYPRYLFPQFLPAVTTSGGATVKREPDVEALRPEDV